MLVERTKKPNSAKLAWKLQHEPQLCLVRRGTYVNSKLIVHILHLGIMKPPNSNTSNTVKLPAVVETTMFWQSDATKRNMDTDVQCKVNSKSKCRKNLKIRTIIGGM